MPNAAYFLWVFILTPFLIFTVSEMIAYLKEKK